MSLDSTHPGLATNTEPSRTVKSIGLAAIADGVTNHLFLLAALGLLVIKLLSIAEYSTSTVLAIVQSTGLTDTLLGVLLPVFPWLVGLLGLSVASRSWPNSNSKLALGLHGLLFVLLAALLPSTILGVLLLAGTALIPLLRLTTWGSSFLRGRATRVAGSIAVGAAVVVLVAAVALDDGMWLPSERVEITRVTQTGAQVGWIAVGYVLSSDTDWTVVLADSPRAILRVRTAEVESRGPCRVEAEERRSSILRSLSNFFSGEQLVVTVPPPCPKAMFDT